jgi:hypothetical protein
MSQGVNAINISFETFSFNLLPGLYGPKQKRDRLRLSMCRGEYLKERVVCYGLMGEKLGSAGELGADVSHVTRWWVRQSSSWRSCGRRWRLACYRAAVDDREIFADVVGVSEAKPAGVARH